MSRKNGPHWIDRELVRAPFFIGLCLSEKQYLAAMRRYKIANPDPWIGPGADATAHHFSSPEGGSFSLICIEPRGKRSRSAWAALLVHEATHVWQMTREKLAERSPSAEFEAYSLQSICQELFEAASL